MDVNVDSSLHKPHTPAHRTGDHDPVGRTYPAVGPGSWAPHSTKTHGMDEVREAMCFSVTAMGPVSEWWVVAALKSTQSSGGAEVREGLGVGCGVRRGFTLWCYYLLNLSGPPFPHLAPWGDNTGSSCRRVIRIKVRICVNVFSKAHGIGWAPHSCPVSFLQPLGKAFSCMPK